MAIKRPRNPAADFSRSRHLFRILISKKNLDLKSVEHSVICSLYGSSTTSMKITTLTESTTSAASSSQIARSFGRSTITTSAASSGQTTRAIPSEFLFSMPIAAS